VIARQDEAADAFHVVDADCHGLHARLDQCRQRRALTGSVILRASTGSFASIEASTTRRPPDTMSWILAKAPLGKALDGQGISWSIEALSSVPKRSDCFATTTVCDLRLVRVEVLRPHGRLVVEPDLGDKHGEQAEDDGKPDHDDGTGTHDDKPRLTRPNSSPVCSCEH